MIWTDNMLIPMGAKDKYTAELMMDWVYDVGPGGRDRRLRLLHQPGQGRVRRDQGARRRHRRRTRSSSRRPEVVGEAASPADLGRRDERRRSTSCTRTCRASDGWREARPS